MKLLNSVRLVSLVSAILLAGCQDTDYDFEKNYLNEDAKAFVEAFEERYGYIDPAHTFNDAFYGSVEVTTDESALVTVSAFIDSEKDATILAQAVVDGTQTIEYDYPNGTARIFVIAKSNGLTDGTILAPGKGGKASFSFAGTRAEFSSTPAVQTTAALVKNVTGFYRTVNGVQVQDYATYYTGGDPSDKIVYDINEWTGKFYSTSTLGDLDGDYSKSYISESMLSSIASYCGSKENSTFFNDAAQNISFQVTSEGPVSLTGVSCTTSSPNTIGYYFTTGDHNTLADFKAADKFILIPKTGYNSVYGKKYYLTYYPTKDSNGNPTGGTHIIPEGTIVHFFLIRRIEGSNPYIDENGDFYLYGDKMWGSEPEITKITADFYNEQLSTGFLTDLATTASFTYNGFMCLGFEDWPGNGMRDWNDCVFTIEGNITNGEKTTTSKLNVFTLAVEDLGVADDQDYNDVVFTVSQEYNVETDDEGNTTLTYEYPVLEFVCAGGTLPLRVYYKNDDGTETTLVEEVHHGFGLSSTGIMINTAGSSAYANYDTDSESSSSAIVRKDPFKVTLENDYFLSNPLRMSKHADNFYIEITKRDGSKLKVNANSNDEADSHTPFVLVIPTDSWEFPKERVNIDLVYSGFKAWVNSQEGGRFWYDETSKEVQEMEEDLMDGASETIGIETTTTSEVDQQHGDNNLGTTVQVGNTYSFENQDFLRQTDNLTYKMLLTIENNSKALLDIETVWGSKEEGTVYLKTLSGSVITSVTPNMTNTVTFENVSVADILNGFCLQNTNSEIKLQSMTLTCHYKAAESFYLEANGTYNYSYPIPETFTNTNPWGNVSTELGYKISITTASDVKRIKVVTKWTQVIGGASISTLSGTEKTYVSSNNSTTITFDNISLEDYGISTGFYITGFTQSNDYLESVQIYAYEEEVVNSATVDADGTLVYSNLTAQTITFTDASGNSSTQQGYKIGLSSDDIDAENVSVETTWSSESVTSATITDLDGKEIVSASASSAKRYGYATANGTKTITFDEVPFASIQNGFFITSSTGSNNLASVKIKAAEEENTGGDDNQGGSDDNQTSGSVLSIGSNSVAPVEEGMYNIWGNYYAYKFTVTIPSNTKSIKLISDWTDTDNYQEVLTVNTGAGANVNATKTWVDGKIHAVINYEINTWLYNYKVSENTYSFLLTHFSQTSTLVNKTITIELVE